MHELRQMFILDAMQVSLDKTVCEMHKCKCILAVNISYQAKEGFLSYSAHISV